MWPDAVLSRFERLTACQRPGTWKARCPAHDDRVPSLSIWLGRNGGLVVRCWARCPVEAILERAGLKMGDLFPPDSARSGPYENAGARSARPDVKKQLVATYDYTDEAGKLLYQKLRYRLPDGSKSFAQRRPDPAREGEWLWSLGDCRRVLYRLPRIMAAHRLMPVVIVEGEGKVHVLEEQGLLATTCTEASSAWLSEYSMALAERRCVIIPDADATGQRHGVEAAGSLMLHGAASIRVVELPDMPVGGSVDDWFGAMGRGKGELIDLILGTREWTWVINHGRRAG